MKIGGSKWGALVVIFSAAQLIACDSSIDMGESSDAGTSFDVIPADPGFPAPIWVEAPGNTGEGTGTADNAINGVRGAGAIMGGSDVFSLGFVDGEDNYIVLSWDGAAVQNGPGADFVVFENGFASGSDYVFMDLAVVYVSNDAENWVAFDYDYIADVETVYVADPDMWSGFAGRSPVLYNVESNPVDPFDHELAGGDQFDLDDLPDDGGDAQAIKESGCKYIKIVTAPSLTNPDTGETFVRDSISNGFDLDGVIARTVE